MYYFEIKITAFLTCNFSSAKDLKFLVSNILTIINFCGENFHFFKEEICF